MVERMITRREFLSSVSATLFLSGTAPGLLGLVDKSGLKPKVIGAGDFQFECNHNWCQLPRHLNWKVTQGVATGKNGLVYIIHQADNKQPSDTIAVFDVEGRFVRSFGKEFSGGGHGIDIRNEDGNDFLYVCDTFQRQVVKLDTFGEWVWKKRYPRASKRYESVDGYQPTNVCFGPQKELFVTDGYGSDVLHQYDSKGAYVRSMGGNGKLAGQFQTPHGVWLDERGPRPSIVVADRGNARIQWLALDGTPQLILQGVDDKSQDGKTSTLPDQNGKPVPVLNRFGISRPANFDLWEGMLLAADMQSHLLLLDERNTVLASLGIDPDWSRQMMNEREMRRQPERWPAGKFIHPHDACFDQDGNIYVTEWVQPGRVTKLTWI